MSREQEFHAFNITEADVDAVIATARAAGEDVQALEEAKAELYGPGKAEVGAARARGWKLKLLIALLRHGGEDLAKLLARLSPKAAGFVRRYAKALADFLETGEISPYLIAVMMSAPCLPPPPSLGAGWPGCSHLFFDQVAVVLVGGRSLLGPTLWPTALLALPLERGGDSA